MFGPQARKGFSRSVLSSPASSWIRPHGQPVARRHVPDMTKITTLAGYTIEGSPEIEGKLAF
jgi:hypothetical protein